MNTTDKDVDSEWTGMNSEEICDICRLLKEEGEFGLDIERKMYFTKVEKNRIQSRKMSQERKVRFHLGTMDGSVRGKHL